MHYQPAWSYFTMLPSESRQSLIRNFVTLFACFYGALIIRYRLLPLNVNDCVKEKKIRYINGYRLGKNLLELYDKRGF